MPGDFPAPPPVGARQVDENGVEWVVVGHHVENGQMQVGRVRAASFAHHVLLEREPRLAPPGRVLDAA